ncbi:FAD-binding oxidoreductase [Streptomyces mirabilis]|uniref:FAD-binding oxidoreductase n=1 Tax=Streptomyces mirabilis TaxID=68239 RepID=UPI0036A85AFA
MSPFSKAHTRLAALRAHLTGDALRPEDPGYDDARTLFNARIDRHPAVIARCETKADVVHCVRFARDLDLHIAIRAGGHSPAGMSLNDNGLVIDLRRMHTVTVHPGSRTVRVEGGALMSHLDHATRPHGLATTGARNSTTGVAGFALGGGTGWLDRAFGLAVDNLLGVELVTADGSQIQATDHEHPELFWALHGGGGNFGVATALTLRLHPLPDFSIALLTYRPESGPDVVRGYREIIETAPPETGGGIIRTQLVDALLTYPGPEQDLRKLARPLLALPHEAVILTALPYAAFQRILDSPPGLRNLSSAESLTGLPDKAVDVFCELGNTMPVPTATRYSLFPQGGAIASGPDRFPVPFRDARWTVHPFGMWEDPADDRRCVQWVEDVRAALRPWSAGAVCLNLVGDEGADRVVAGLGAGNIRRLAAVKAAYDPDNVFRFNHNILPR